MRRCFLFVVSLLIFLCAVSSLSYAQTNIALNKSYTLTPLPDSSWPGTDPNFTKLTDSNFDRSAGVGWTQKPVIVLDLGGIYSISNILIYFYDADSYYAPSYITVETSTDGVNFISVGNISSWSTYITYAAGVFVQKGSIVSSVNGRYVRYSPVGGYNSNFCCTEIQVEGISTPVVPTPTPSIPPVTPTPPPSTPTPPPATPTPLSATPTPQATPTGSVTVSFGGVVYGRVIDKFKSPLPEIKVEYSTLGDEYLGKNPVLTDNDGYYYFEDVDTQFGYGLQMTAKRYGTITLNYAGGVQDSVVSVPDQMLIRGNSDKFTLSGTVKDLYLTPIEHARVRVKSSGDPRIVYTDSLGAFSVSDLFIGTYTVTVKRDGYWSGRVKYYNTDALDGSVEISLQEK